VAGGGLADAVGLEKAMDESNPITQELNRHLDELAQVPLLLVASDFDGTLAPIVADPALAEANRESLVALKALEALPQTHVSIISGRALRDLAMRMGQPEEVHLVGSHGSEFEAGFAVPLPAGADDLIRKLNAELHRISRDTPGSVVEEKPAALAFHYRNSDDEAARGALELIITGPARWNGVHVRQGKKVVELSVVETNKGQALQRIRQRLGARAVFFLGDDTTDEDAFATLSGPDVGIKVGEGETKAKYRIRDTLEAAQVLARVAEKRAAWLAGAEAVPIDQHAILSDQRTVAIVNPAGRIVWLCLPRLDSSAVFAELLGGPAAGYFEIRPASQGHRARPQYSPDSFVLQTCWPGLRVIDYLNCSEGRPYQRAGRTDLIRVIEGVGRARITFAPRLDFGRVVTRLRIAENGLEIEGALDTCVLFAPGISWQLLEEGRHQTAVAEIEMAGQPIVLELRYGTGNLAPALVPETVRRQQTERFWSGWAATLELPDLRPELVQRSALVLKALSYGPTGAIAAAATTSLPECFGGVRNWDYRFCWPRDAAMAAAALVRLGVIGPAMKLLDWVLATMEHCEPPAFICPVYTVTGGHLGTEGEIGELAGYRGSRPIRVGNSAAHQIQLDVLGPIAELLALLAQHGAALSSEHWRLLELMVDAVAHRWPEADHGIWELRRPRRQHVHSKVMCWQTVDRALQVATYLGRRRPDWGDLRQAIAADVLTRGWNADRKAFCATYDDSEIDSAALAAGLSGLLAPNDERFAATVAAVERELREGPTVFRYRYDDGLPGIEGGFHLATTWLIESYAIMGRWADARRLFDEYANLVGPLGLLSEEYDPDRRQALGNFPQAYSHIGLINAACRLGLA
jgi:trehalose 6-phosphate phosphatase